MNRVRKLNPAPQKKSAVGQSQWNQLLRRAIARAQNSQDPRLPLLQQALRAGTAEAALRRMSVICDADIDREFRDSPT